MQPNEPYMDIIMNVEIYRAAVFRVTALTMKPMLLNICGHTTWSQRSLTRSLWKELRTLRMAANMYGGDDNSKVIVVLNPSVLTIVGKKLVKAADVLSPNCISQMI
jgi:hypothetical protein